MKTKTIILTITAFLLLLDTFGQTDQKTRKYLQYNGLVSDMAICFDCRFDTILSSIKLRLENYTIDPNTEFVKQKGDTLIEIVSFNRNKQPNYSYYYNNLLKINYSKTDSNNLILTIMNDFEMEQKQWIINAKELHITDYDQYSNINHYYAEFYPGKRTKIEFEKEWKNGRFKFGQSKTYKKENTGWTLQKTEELDVHDWPKSTTEPVKIDNKEGFTNLQKVNLAHHIGSFEEKQYLIENHDSSISFLPYRLKNNLEAGTYKIYEKFEKDLTKSNLLIDANILKGKLHGVYNEYDQNHGKIRIYCIYDLGLLDGRKTIYFYDKKGNFDYKITELWNNGKFIDKVN